MSIGIAANATIFTLVDALLLKQLPVRNPEELVSLIEHHPPLPDSSQFGYSYWRMLNEHSTSYSAVIGQADAELPMTVGSVSESVNVALVTENYFAVLGVAPALGTLPAPRTRPSSAIISGAAASIPTPPSLAAPSN